MRRRRVAALVAGAALVALSARQPTLDLRLVTHDSTGSAPQVMRAAVDLGVVAVSLLYTRTVDAAH